MKVTANSLLNSGLQIIFTIALGTFLLINAAIIVFKVSEGYDNYQFIQQRNIVAEGRIHVFDSRDFTVSSYGIPRKCVAIENHAYNTISVYDESVGVPGFIPTPIQSQYCNHLLNISNWKAHAPVNDGMHPFERILWSIAVGAVILSGGYVLMSVPAMLFALTLPILVSWSRLITIAFTIPIFAFCFIFMVSVWTSTPSYWITANAETIDTQKVFIAADGTLYKAPETLYDWTNTQTATELLEKYR